MRHLEQHVVHLVVSQRAGEPKNFALSLQACCRARWSESPSQNRIEKLEISLALYLKRCIFSAPEEGLKYNDNDKYTYKDRKNDNIRQLMFPPSVLGALHPTMLLLRVLCLRLQDAGERLIHP